MSAPGGDHERDLADAVRSLIDQMMTTHASPAATAAAAAAVNEVTAALVDAGGMPRPAVTQAPDDHMAVFFRFSPVSGESNPLAPPLRLEVQHGQVVGTVQFGRAYEGPPGYAHGAFVAAIFDQLLGFTNAALGVPAMTGLLEVRYHRPTPLGTELKLVGRPTGTSGRKSYATGEVLDRDTILAEAKATFVAVTAERALQLFGAQSERGESEQLDVGRQE